MLPNMNRQESAGLNAASVFLAKAASKLKHNQSVQLICAFMKY